MWSLPRVSKKPKERQTDCANFTREGGAMTAWLIGVALHLMWQRANIKNVV